jgi:hypothetical protein
MNIRSGSPENNSKPQLSTEPAIRHMALPVVISAIPYNKVSTQTILPIQSEHYNSLLDKFNDIYQQRHYKKALAIGHELLYQIEIPLEIRFKVSSLSDAAHCLN